MPWRDVLAGSNGGTKLALKFTATHLKLEIHSRAKLE